MGRRVAQAAMAAILPLVMLVVGASAASALSCAGPIDASPRAVAEGTAQLGFGAFRDVYEGVIFGTVTATNTQENPNRPDYGRTQVLVEVTATFGPSLPNEVVLVMPDPGWMAGVNYEVGTHYFIPYTRDGADLLSGACDPVAPVDAAEVPELVGIAKQHAWADAAELAADGSATPSSSDAATWRWWAAAFALLAVAGGVTLAVRARRGGQTHVG